VAHALRRFRRIDEENDMARSTLNTTGESDPVVRKGHGTGALGPSDSSDSGSDIVGGPGLNHDDGLPLQRGTTSDPDIDPAGATAGADIGDADLDSDSDRNGTGERGAAGRDSTEAVDETLTERDGDDVESIRESGTQREANDIESDDRPDEDVDAT
jgi:predicted  nucleic acid-binding Zn-ribbon protein